MGWHERWALIKRRRNAEKDFAKLISNPKTVAKVVTFIHETGRFAQEGIWKGLETRDGSTREGGERAGEARAENGDTITQQ